MSPQPEAESFHSEFYENDSLWWVEWRNLIAIILLFRHHVFDYIVDPSSFLTDS